MLGEFMSVNFYEFGAALRGRVIAIGDIHGCHDMLTTLLQAITLTQDDTLIFLGDLIDRGADSKGVIETIRHYENKCTVIRILGNHEEMMLRSRHRADDCQLWLQVGGAQTLESFGLSPTHHGLMSVPSDDVAWLQNAKDYLETDKFIFCHATPDHDKPMSEQTAETWRWRHLGDLPHRHISGKTIVCGHTPQPDGDVYCMDGLICLDTYAFGGGKLTALDVLSDTLWQVDTALQVVQSHLSMWGVG